MKDAPLVLASSSATRQNMLRSANIPFESIPPRIDEESLRVSLKAENAQPRDIADALAEMKALRISDKKPGALVLGCDQVLAFEGIVFSKPQDPDHARDQLATLSGKAHQLLSAAVIYKDGKPAWRHVGVVRLQMRDLSRDYIQGYVDRNWDSIRHSVGAYKIEEEGVRLFSRIDGSHFSILGLPLIELIGFLTIRGVIKQ